MTKKPFLIACLASQQHVSVSQRQICADNCTLCHTETEAADPTCYLAKSQCTDIGPTSPCAGTITPGTWQGNHWSPHSYVTDMTLPCKIPVGKAGIGLITAAIDADSLPQHDQVYLKSLRRNSCFGLHYVSRNLNKNIYVKQHKSLETLTLDHIVYLKPLGKSILLQTE